MDVRCERCKTEYEFDEARITDAGVTVKCTTCGHVFRVKKKTLAVTMPATPPSEFGQDKPREWKLRQANGQIVNFKELTTLQKWIVERKVGRDDEISITGESWKPLGAIVELSSFFKIVEEADSRKPSPQPLALGAPSGPNVVRGHATQPEFKIDPGPVPEPYRQPKKSGRGLLTLLFLTLLGAGAYFGYVYVWEPREREARLNAEAEAAAIKAREDEARKAAADAGASSAAVAPPPPAAEVSEEVDAGVVEPAVPDAGPVEETPAEPAKPVKTRQGARLDFDGYMQRAEALRERERHAQALDAYGAAAELEPQRAEPVAGRGLVFLDRDQWVQAEASFKSALKLNPRYGVAIMGLAETYRAQGKTDAAIAEFERYLEVLPEGPEANVAKNALRQLKQ